MGLNASSLGELERMRARGSKPDGPIIAGDAEAAAWARRNNFFFVPVRELLSDETPLIGLPVIVRMRRPWAFGALYQRMAMSLGPICVFDTETHRSEWVCA